jgi:hypothetical protein
MAIALLEIDGAPYLGYCDAAKKLKNINEHSFQISASKAHVKQGGSEINFRYKGHAVRIVYGEKKAGVYVNGTKRPEALVEKMQPLDSSRVVVDPLRARVCELEKAQIRTAARLKALEAGNFALRKIVAEMVGE